MKNVILVLANIIIKMKFECVRIILQKVVNVANSCVCSFSGHVGFIDETCFRWASLLTPDSWRFLAVRRTRLLIVIDFVGHSYNCNAFPPYMATLEFSHYVLSIVVQ